MSTMYNLLHIPLCTVMLILIFNSTAYCHAHSFTFYILFFISYFSFILSYVYFPCVVFSIFALSMERTRLSFHCWLYNLCIVVYVTNKTWNLKTWNLRGEWHSYAWSFTPCRFFFCLFFFCEFTQSSSAEQRGRIPDSSAPLCPFSAKIWRDRELWETGRNDTAWVLRSLRFVCKKVSAPLLQPSTHPWMFVIFRKALFRNSRWIQTLLRWSCLKLFWISNVCCHFTVFFSQRGKSADVLSCTVVNFICFEIMQESK